MIQRLLKAVGGTLEHTPRDVRLRGAPLAAVVTLIHADGGMLASPVLQAAATVDPFSATITADVSAGDREVPLSSTVGLVPGRRYLLSLPEGQRLVCRVAGEDVDSASLFSALPIDVPYSSTLQGIVLSIGIGPQDADAALDMGLVPSVYRDGGGPGPRRTDPSLNRAAWTISYATGSPVSADDLWRVVPRLLASPAQPDELDSYLSLEASRLARPDQAPQFEAIFDAAWLEVLEDMEVAGWRPDRVMNPDRLRLPHIYKTLALLAGTWGQRFAEYAAEKRAEYSERLESALAAGDWYDSDDSASMDAGEIKYASMDLIR